MFFKFKLNKILPVWIFVFSFQSFSQINGISALQYNKSTLKINRQKISITDKLMNKEFQLSIIQNTLRENPLIFAKMLKKLNEGVEESTYSIGEKRDFYTYNDLTHSYNITNMVLMRQGSFANIWVDTIEIINGHITEIQLDSVLSRLETSTPSESRDSTKGIINLCKNLFGLPPNINSLGQKNMGDGKLDVLILDIKDDFDDSGSYIAGFFNPIDQIVSSSASNKHDMLYIDTYPTIYFEGERDITMATQTTAHEYQHLIHFNYDPDELEFVNESCSQNAEMFCGFNPFNGIGESGYFSNTNKYLFSWDGLISDYSRATIWMLYMIEQVGDNLTKAIVQNPSAGLTGITSALSQVGSQNTFYDLLKNWAIANYINDRNMDSRYGFKRTISGKPSTLLFIDPNTNINYDNVAPLGIRYIIFKNSAKNFKYKFLNIPGYLNVRIIKINSSSKQIEEIFSGVQYELPEFAESLDQVVFVLTNVSSTQSANYLFTSSGEAIIRSEEIAYDSGIPSDLGGFSYLKLPGKGNGFAVKFYPRYVKNLLKKVKLWVAFDQEFTPPTVPSDAPKRFEFHIWKAATDSMPGTDIISPFIYSVSRPNTIPNDFVEIDLRLFASQLTDLVKPVYVGFLEDDSYPTNIALNDLTPGNYSYAKGIDALKRWYKLNTLTVTGDNGDISLEGYNAMIRAEFQYDYQNGVKEIIDEFAGYSLSQNFPNPFNPETRINYSIPEKTFVKLEIYDILGRKVKDLIAEVQGPGKYAVIWKGENNYGKRVSSGIYIYKIKTDKYSEIKKLSFLK